MANETGLLQYASWDEDGDTPTLVSPGLITGGEPYGEYSHPARHGLGGQTLPFAEGFRAGCRLDVNVTNESKILLGYAVRASYPAGALTEILVKAGTASYDFLYRHALINSLRVSCAPEQPLAASLDIIALTETEDTTGDTVEAIAVGLMPWGNGSITIGGSPYDCVGYELNLNNGCGYRFDLDAKSADEKRWPTSIRTGREQVTLSVQLREKLVFDVDADAPATNLAAVITGNDGTNTITFTFANLRHTGGRRMPFVNEDDDTIWPYQFAGVPGSLVIT